jgi:hypothetical protein
MLQRPDRPAYQSPPNSGGNDGALPTVYDPIWQSYVNLTTAQQFAFQGFPQALTWYAGVQRWLAEISGTSVTFTPTGSAVPITIALDTGDRSKTLLIGARQAIDDGLVTTVSFNGYALDAAGTKTVHSAVMAFVQALFAAQNKILAGIGSSITSWSQIDAIYAAIAPNSVSATRPAPPPQ